MGDGLSDAYRAQRDFERARDYVRGLVESNKELQELLALEKSLKELLKQQALKINEVQKKFTEIVFSYSDSNSETYEAIADVMGYSNVDNSIRRLIMDIQNGR